MTVSIETADDVNDRLMILYENAFLEGTLAASAEITDGDKENAVDWKTNTYWSVSTVPETLSVSGLSATTRNCAYIDAHNLGTQGATLKVESHNGSVWGTIATVVPTDDSPILVIFDDRSHTQYRIEVSNAGHTSETYSIGVAMIGKRLSPPIGVSSAGHVLITEALEMPSHPNISIRGDYNGAAVYKRGLNGSISLPPIDRSWFDANMDTFREHYNGMIPFAMASAPAVYAKDVAYCWRNGGTLQPRFRQNGLLVDLSMRVGGYVY